MCGIVGYAGERQAAPILLDGLAKLEYRGYDSAGLAVRNGASDPEIVKNAFQFWKETFLRRPMMGSLCWETVVSVIPDGQLMESRL